MIGEAADGVSALDAVTELQPDLVLLDVQLPDMSGFDVCAALEGRNGAPAGGDPRVEPGRVGLRRTHRHVLRVRFRPQGRALRRARRGAPRLSRLTLAFGAALVALEVTVAIALAETSNHESELGSEYALAVVAGVAFMRLRSHRALAATGEPHRDLPGGRRISLVPRRPHRVEPSMDLHRGVRSRRARLHPLRRASPHPPDRAVSTHVSSVSFPGSSARLSCRSLSRSPSWIRRRTPSATSARRIHWPSGTRREPFRPSKLSTPPSASSWPSSPSSCSSDDGGAPRRPFAARCGPYSSPVAPRSQRWCSLGC